eukprot:SAG31_NODE_30015_length_386_cov_1.125436_1_plen_96_part_10
MYAPRNPGLIEKLSPGSTNLTLDANETAPDSFFGLDDTHLMGQYETSYGGPTPVIFSSDRGKGLLSRFCATIRETRNFNRETCGTDRESVCINRPE